MFRRTLTLPVRGTKCSFNNLRAIQVALTNIFPHFCACEVMTISGSRFDQLSEVERHSISTSAPTRQAEFATGRVAARIALARIGHQNAVIPAGKDRAPVWPLRYTGSISHTDGCAAAVVVRKTDLLSVGVDIELNNTVSESMWNEIFTDSEQQCLQDFNIAKRARWATAIFCAKEAFYKFQYVVTKSWLDFISVEIDVNESRDWVSVTVNNCEVARQLQQISFVTRVEFAENHTIAGVYERR